MIVPQTLEEVRRLVESRFGENRYLDYKSSASLEKNNIGAELAKDVSAFANSEGGVLIYGVKEDNKSYPRLPLLIDEGVSPSINKEQIENIINSNIRPTIDGIRIIPIPLESGRHIYVIQIPQSNRAPHQALDFKCYYKRYNFKSEPMEHYEIEDVRRRQHIRNANISIHLDHHKRSLLRIVIENDGEVPLYGVNFKLSDSMKEWSSKLSSQSVLIGGAGQLRPGQKHAYNCDVSWRVIQSRSVFPSKFYITATYSTSVDGDPFTQRFDFDVAEWADTAIVASQADIIADQINESLKPITEELRRIRGSLENLAPLVGPSGLMISVSSIRSLASIFQGKLSFGKMDIRATGGVAIREALGIGLERSFKLYESLMRVGGKFEDMQDKQEFQDIRESYHEHFYDE